MIDREKRDERNQIWIPSEFKHVSSLFEALKNGYNSGSSRSATRPQVVIHQPTIQEVSPRRERRRVLEPIVIPAERYSAGHRSPRYRDERYYQELRRGSLYHEDQRRRHYRNAEIMVTTPERYYR